MLRRNTSISLYPLPFKDFRQRKRPLLLAALIFFGGDGRDRTADLLIANQSLSQLSYAPKRVTRILRGLA